MSPDKQLFILVVIFGVTLVFQEYNFGSSFDLKTTMLKRDIAWILPRSTSNSRQPELLPSKHKRLKLVKGMAACLMVRDDNSLIYEWLAYHYQILPLRHVLVAADQNSTENPLDVLQRWDGTHLKYTIWKDTDFMYRFGAIPVGLEDQNHHYLHRQRAFFSSCSEYMKAQNETWVVFVDTDEFVVINKINTDDAPFFQEEMLTNTSRYSRFQQRLKINGVSTVLDAIDVSNIVAPLEPCHVIPRLLISALENETCPQMDHVKDVMAAKSIDASQLSTIRFVQTAPKNTFYPSKWGKVMVDVSRLSDTSLAKKPKSSHRPFVECPKPLRAFEEAIVHANHYLGSWERYSARKDSRRSRRAFEDRAYFSHGLACEMHTDQWLLDLVEEFGVERTKFLLGHG